MLEENPSLSLAQLAEVFRILPEDRFHQATYFIHTHAHPRRILSPLFPESVTNKEQGYGRFNEGMHFKDTEQFTDNLETIVENLQRSSGVCLLVFYTTEKFAHAVVLIVDRVNGRYGIIDTNVGIIDFSYQKDNPDVAAASVFECAQDLLSDYGEMQLVEVRQNQPKVDSSPNQDQGPEM